MAPVSQTTLVYTNPNTLEGDPFQVAAAAFEQSTNLGKLYAQSIKDATKMARIAEMERQIQGGEEPNGGTFDKTPLGSRLGALYQQTAVANKSLGAVGTAASFNPKNPPKEA